MAARIAQVLLALALLALAACGEDAATPSPTAGPSVSPASSPTPEVSVPSPTATPFPVFEVPEPSFAYAAVDGTIWLASADGSARRQLLPSVGQNADEASRNVAWSPDGRFLSYVAGEGELTLLEVDTGRQVVLDDGSDGLVRSGSDWSPDGQHVAYNTIHGELRIASLDGSHWFLPEVRSWGQYVSWSPDGAYIAYLGPEPSSVTDIYIDRPQYPLFIVNIDGSHRRQLRDDVSGTPFAPYWSPGGRLLAYWKNEHGGSAFVGDICVIDVVTARETCLGGFTSDEGGGWAPDPDQYIYHNLRIDPDSGTFSELFERPGVLLDWSPDANRVAYVEDGPLSQGARSLVILNLADYQATRLHTTSVRTPHHTPPYRGNWSPDSRYFAYTALETETTGASMYVADLRSGKVTPVVGPFPPGYDFPSYSPDGSRLLIKNDPWDLPPSVLVANPDGSGVSRVADGIELVSSRAGLWRPAAK